MSKALYTLCVCVALFFGAALVGCGGDEAAQAQPVDENAAGLQG